jgi:thiamine biosynthesis lipoprotein
MKKPISILIVSFLICGCTSEKSDPHTTAFTGNVMTINYQVIVGKKLNREQLHAVQVIITETFDEINNVYNKWNPKSELSILNKSKKLTPLSISDKLSSFFEETNRIVQLSNSRFDPTIEPLQKLWKQELAFGKIPSDVERNKVMATCGWNKIHFENGLFYKDHDETSLDLGGIAKGYAVDLLTTTLNNAGYLDIFVEWGGEIKATGLHPDNRPWHIYIANLQNTEPESAIAHVDVVNKAVATSGDYLQNWTVKSNKNSHNYLTYFHVIDLKTGMPLEIKEHSIASASVMANSCMVADALATTLMMFENAETAVSWFETVKDVYPEAECWIVTR